MQAPGRGSVKGAVLEPPSRSITRPQAMVFAGIGKNHRARCKMIHFATSPFQILPAVLAKSGQMRYNSYQIEILSSREGGP